MHRIIERGDRKLREFAGQSETDLRNLLLSAKRLVKDRAHSETSEKLRALEVMPQEVKLLYTRAIVAQSLIDGEPDPREIASIYVFASRIELDSACRREVRRYLSSPLAEGARRPSGVLKLASETVSGVREDEKDIVGSSLIKDLLWISRADGAVSSTERSSIEAVAREHFGNAAEEVVQQAAETIDAEEAYVRGDISVGEFEKRIKQIASQAVAIGLPVAAIYFSGSVVGLSAAGFTSGLAALGLGGLLGLSSMLTGLGVVIVGGVVVYQLARWTLGVNERELAKKREHMIQEMLKRLQKSMADLAKDIAEIAVRMEEYTAKSDRNAEKLAQLKSELEMFEAALATLRAREENLEDKEERFAT